MAFNFFNSPPSPNLTTEKPALVSDSTPGQESVPNPAPVPGAIPEKADLAFFDNLVKEAPAAQEPGTPISISKDILTPENLKKIADAHDFSSNIPPEVLQKLQSGDQGAMMEAVKAMTSAAYSTALSRSGTIAEAALTQHTGILREQLKAEIMESLNLKDVTKDLPGTDSPAVRNMARMISADLTKQFPQASPSQIRSMTQQYFAEVSGALNPAPTPDPATIPDEPVNWAQYVGMEKVG